MKAHLFSSALAFLALLFLIACADQALAQVSTPGGHAVTDGPSDRAYEVALLARIADPVLTALSQNQLHVKMPVEGSVERRPFSHLEAFGRLLSGLAPWLELGPDDTAEGKLRAHDIDLSVKALKNAVDPKSPDFLNYTTGSQPVVDTAFLALGLLRAPKQLWGNLAPADQARVVAALKSTRSLTTHANNWELFSSIIEAALWHFTGECDLPRLQKGVADHLLWYKGDGVYGDGPSFHWDYYNSYVIQPMFLQVLQVCQEKKSPLAANYPLELARAQRYAAIQERLISPEGTFPVMGRSSAYRFGAFQDLALIALMHRLPPALSPAAVRSGLDAVIRRMMEAPGTFDAQGWLQIGAVGHQPSIKEEYISTGSLYLCTDGLIQLGLPASDPYWQGPDQPWTQKRIWAGEPDIEPDHAINN